MSRRVSLLSGFAALALLAAPLVTPAFAGSATATNTVNGTNVAAGFGNVATQQLGGSANVVKGGSPFYYGYGSGRGPATATNTIDGTNVAAGAFNSATQQLGGSANVVKGGYPFYSPLFLGR